MLTSTRAYNFQCSSFTLAYPHRALSALTLISLSFAIDAWLKTSSKRAWTRRSLPTRSSSTTSFTTASTTTSTKSATRSLQRTLLFNGLVQLLDQQHLHRQQLLEEKSLLTTMSFQKLFGNRSLKSTLQQNLYNNISFSKTSLTTRRRTRSNRISFQHQFQTENLANFIFTSFMIKINLSQAQSTFPEEQCFSSFSKKELERLHLTRSILEQNLSQVQLVYYKFSTRAALTSTASTRATLTRAASNTAASPRAASKRAASTRAAWKRAARRAALNRAAWSRTASKTPALQQAASEATTFRKTAWKQQPAWQTGTLKDQFCQLSWHSLSEQLWHQTFQSLNAQLSTPYNKAAWQPTASKSPA